MQKETKGEKGDTGADGSNATVTAGTGIAVSDGEVSLNAGLNDLNDVVIDKGPKPQIVQIDHSYIGNPSKQYNRYCFR